MDAKESIFRQVALGLYGEDKYRNADVFRILDIGNERALLNCAETPYDGISIPRGAAVFFVDLHPSTPWRHDAEVHVVFNSLGICMSTVSVPPSDTYVLEKLEPLREAVQIAPTSDMRKLIFLLFILAVFFYLGWG